MGRAQKMVEYAVAIANDDSHGYSQVRRWPSQGTDFDCASLMYQVAHDAGFDVTVGPAGTHYTGTMVNDFQRAGFEAVGFSGIDALSPGDILVRDPWGVGGHTEMYIGNGQFVGAHIAETGGTDGRPGDQTGREISVCDAYGGWDYVLVPPKDAPKKGSKMNGIDIASYQEGLVPSKMATTDFIIVKATGGNSYTNACFKGHADATLAAGKLLGCYHFACEYGIALMPEQEADYFLGAVKPYVGKATLWLDYEMDALENYSPAWCKKWLDRVRAKTGCTPGIYMSKSVCNSRDWSAVAKDYPLWVAQYPDYSETGYKDKPWTDSSGYGAWKAPTIFQYTSSGKIPGYGSHLDLNLFYGSRVEWAKLVGTSKPVKPEPAVTQPRYRVWRDGKWQAWHSNGVGAGKAGHPVYDIDFSGLPSGSWWRLTLQGGHILDKNIHNAARKTPVVGIEVFYKTAKPDITGYHEALYRVHAGGQWLKWEHDVDDGGAGDDANVVDVFQFKVAPIGGEAKPTPDNSTLARAACSLSYSQPAKHNPSTGANPRTSTYAKVYDALFKAKDTRKAAPRVYNVQGRSCDRSMACAVLWSGCDDSMPRTSAAIYSHLAKSSRWKDMGKWSGKESDLKPGDILVRLKTWPGVTGNHLCMYVGHATAEEVYRASLKGTDADKGKPKADAAWVSGHLAGGNPPDKGYAPCIGDARYAGAKTSARVFRCIKPQKSSKYTNL